MQGSRCSASTSTAAATTRTSSSRPTPLVPPALRRQLFDAIHASPPCQAYSKAQRLRDNDHDRLIAALRQELEKLGKPYVIENVEGARGELRDPVMLCGTMFGLRLYRHRLFETNWPLTAPLHGQHYLRQVKMGRKPGPQDILQPVGNFTGVDAAREAMGMPWASRDGLREAIPPAYTEYIGASSWRCWPRRTRSRPHERLASGQPGVLRRHRRDAGRARSAVAAGAGGLRAGGRG
jgi:hypothetical protein